MDEGRLESLVLISSERDVAEDIRLDSLVDVFALMLCPHVTHTNTRRSKVYLIALITKLSYIYIQRGYSCISKVFKVLLRKCVC